MATDGLSLPLRDLRRHPIHRTTALYGRTEVPAVRFNHSNGLSITAPLKRVEHHCAQNVSG